MEAEDGVQAVKHLALNPQAIATLNAAGAKLKAPAKPLSDKAVQIIRRSVARTVFGPSMQPTLRQRCRMWTSFAAVKAGWAAAHWQQKMKEKYG